MILLLLLCIIFNLVFVRFLKLITGAQSIYLCLELGILEVFLFLEILVLLIKLKLEPCQLG